MAKYVSYIPLPMDAVVAVKDVIVITVVGCSETRMPNWPVVKVLSAIINQFCA